MVTLLNLAMAVFLLVLAHLWHREARLSRLSLASRGTRIVVIAFATLGLVTLGRPAAVEFLPEAVPFADSVLPTVAWALRTFIGIIMLALVVTTVRARRHVE